MLHMSLQTMALATIIPGQSQHVPLRLRMHVESACAGAPRIISDLLVCVKHVRLDLYRQLAVGMLQIVCARQDSTE